MEKKRRVLMAVLLILTVGNYFRLPGSENVRVIQFLLIFVMGLLSGLLLNEFVTLFRSKRN